MTTDENAAETSENTKDREYVVVARRYRPKSFEELVGQAQVSQALSNAINTNRVGHAYLFTGARGVGKTSTARILAKCLNCIHGPTPEPCGQCDNCLSVSSGDDVDVLEIDGASNRGIDEIRQLRSNVNIRPSRSHFKIYIIDEVHMLTMAAFNALLKTLEEPPEHVKFIFCTTDPEKIPITVLSRCQRFDFAPVATDSIVDRLKHIVHSEGVVAEDAALQMLARRAAGSMRDSQSLLEQLLSFCGDSVTEADVHAMLGTAESGRLGVIAEHLVARDAAAALADVDLAIREGVDVGQLAEQLLGYLRDMMAATVGCDADFLMNTPASEHVRLAEFGKDYGLETILAAVQILDHAIARMRQSTQVRTLVEVALVRICKLEDLEDLSTLIGALRGGATLKTDSPPAKKKTATSIADQPSPPAREQGSVRNDSPSRELAANGLSGATPEPYSTEGFAADAKAVDTSPPNEEMPPSASPLTLQMAEQKWREVLDEIGGMTADEARNYQSLAISAPNRLVVHLKSAYNKERCERAEVKRELEETMTRVSGRTVRIDFAVAETPKKQPRPRVGSSLQSQRIMMQEVEQNPLVQEVVKLFGAEVIKVDPGKPA